MLYPLELRAHESKDTTALVYQLFFFTGQGFALPVVALIGVAPARSTKKKGPVSGPLRCTNFTGIR